MKRFEGKNLDEALENASRALNVERYRLSYHVVMEKRGFLGGMKRVVVEADINDAATPPPAPPSSLDYDDSVQPPSLSYESELGLPRQSRQRDRGPRRGRGRRGGGGGERGGGRNGGRREGRGRSPMEGREPLRQDRVVETIPEQGEESTQARRVRDWFEELFDLADLELVVRTNENEEQLQVRLYGADATQVLAHGGELLDSLQVLVNKALVGRGEEKPVELDCREFKGRRTSSLERRAREIADEVRSSGREHILEAMSPIERRIVHLALQDDGEVATESRGEGFYKRIAIVLRKPEAAPRPDAES